MITKSEDLHFFRTEMRTDAPLSKSDRTDEIGTISARDEGFPRPDLSLCVSEAPSLFAYRGDLSLLRDIRKNVAVIGVLNPTKEIEARERKAVRMLVESGFSIVSGLARGCDAIAHTECLACGGKTIAFLPTTLQNIYPRENAKLADEIAERGGLVVTEYLSEAASRGERIGRFLARDRLQAMFSFAVILIASYRKGEGDSGSRHAMEKAKQYGRARYAMYREEDEGDPRFGLNRLVLGEDGSVLTPNTIAAGLRKGIG